MNPVDRFRIDNFKEVLQEIERLGHLEYLRDLENKILVEIVNLIEEGTDEARVELTKLEKMISDDLSFKPRNQLLISALKNSIAGALSAAKFCL